MDFKTASGSGDSELQVLDNVIMMGVKGHHCLPEALVIWEEGVPCAVYLQESMQYLFSLYSINTHVLFMYLEGGYVTIRHPVIMRPAPVLHSLY